MTTLRTLRQYRGLSLLDVERATSINRGTLSKIERGIETPSAGQLRRLSVLYNVDPLGWTTRLQYVYPEELADVE